VAHLEASGGDRGDQAQPQLGLVGACEAGQVTADGVEPLAPGDPTSREVIAEHRVEERNRLVGSLGVQVPPIGGERFGGARDEASTVVEVRCEQLRPGGQEAVVVVEEPDPGGGGGGEAEVPAHREPEPLLVHHPDLGVLRPCRRELGGRRLGTLVHHHHLRHRADLGEDALDGPDDLVGAIDGGDAHREIGHGSDRRRATSRTCPFHP
jgi:hypothetical protein